MYEIYIKLKQASFSSQSFKTKFCFSLFMVVHNYDTLDLNNTVKALHVSRFDSYDRRRWDVILVDTNFFLRDGDRTRVQAKETAGARICTTQSVLEELAEIYSRIGDVRPGKDQNIDVRQIDFALAYVSSLERKGNIICTDSAKQQSPLVTFEDEVVLAKLGSALTKTVFPYTVAGEFEAVFALAVDIHALAREKQISFDTIINRFSTTRSSDHYASIQERFSTITQVLEESVERRRNEMLLAAHYQLPGIVDYNNYIRNQGSFSEPIILALKKALRRLCVKLAHSTPIERARTEYLDRREKQDTDRGLVLAGYALAPVLYDASRIIVATRDNDLHELLSMRQNSSIRYQGAF